MHNLAQSPSAARRVLGWLITGLVLIAVALSIGLLFGRGSTAATGKQPAAGAGQSTTESSAPATSTDESSAPETSTDESSAPETSTDESSAPTSTDAGSTAPDTTGPPPARAPPTRQVPHRRRAPPTPQAPPSQVRIWVCPRRSPTRPATASG